MFKENILGIDIGAMNTKIVHGNWDGRSVQISRAFMVPTPSGAIADGHFLQRPLLEESLRKALNDKHIKKDEVIFTVDSTEIILREIILPKVSDKELQGMLSFEVEKNFPIRVEDYSIEFQKVEELNEDGIPKIRLLVAALPKDITLSCLELARGLGLKPLALRLQADCCSKLFANAKTVNGTTIDPAESIALIDLGHGKLRVSFVTQGRMTFTRTIAYKSRDLDNKISTIMGITLDKAKILKQQSSLLPHTEEEENQEQQMSHLLEIIKEKADEWIEMIQPIFRYYLSQAEGNKIDKIYLYGGYSMIQGLEEYFQEAFNRSTQSIKDMELIKPVQKNMDIPLQFYLNAIGSLILS